MRAHVIRIGNSRGIRIPKPLLEECRLGDTVEFDVRDGQLLVRAAGTPRSAWEDAFREMARRGDDALLDQEGWD